MKLIVVFVTLVSELGDVMLRRKAYDRLLDWKANSHGRTALLIEGARRVGKSTLAQEFGRREYKSCLTVDFTHAPDDVLGYFQDMRDDLDSFFMYLSAHYGVTLHRRDSLIIFDEVQLYPKAREAIKQFVADGRFDFIETGSLVSIRANVKDILIPSEERPLSLEPFDFEEFLWAMGEEPLWTAIADSYRRLKPLPESLHRKAMRLFREYMLVGGMPQAVDEYVQSRDFARVDDIKRDILRLYRADIAKHAGGATRRVTLLFDGLVSQLSKHEKRYSLHAIDENARIREYDEAFFWLEDARVVNTCVNATDPTVGLAASADRATIKCYMADTGLLVTQALADSAMTDDDIYRDVLLGKISLNEGMLTENVVSQLIHASGHRLFFYSRHDRADASRTMEIDFLIVARYPQAAMKPRISPIEVKSGTRYGTSSLNKFKARFDKRIGCEYVLHPKPLQVEGDCVRLPLYMAGLL